MKAKHWLMGVAAAMVMIGISSEALARPRAAARRKVAVKKRAVVNRPWEARADTNKDGKVGPGELRAYRVTVLDKNKDGKICKLERNAYWAKHRAKVNTEREKKYDADGDGWINGPEAKEMLKDRLRVIKTHGKAKVDSPIEEEYDADNDGIIDREEAAAIRDALGND